MDECFASIYSKEVFKHIRNPRNMGRLNKPDGEGQVGNPVCGDIMKFYIKVVRLGNKEYIKDIKFQTLGCGAAIASSSMLTVLVKGKELKEANKTSKDALVKALGWLPTTKTHCATLAGTALKKAIEDYRLKKKK